MVDVFLITNPITERISKYISKKCCSTVSINYRYESNFADVNVNIEYLKKRKIDIVYSRFRWVENISRIIKARNECEIFKDKVIKLVGDKPFRLYVPHLFYESSVIMSSMDKCRKINFVEEGGFSYEKKQRLMGHPERLRRKVEKGLNRILISTKLNNQKACKKVDTAFYLGEGALEWVKNREKVPKKEIFRKRQHVKNSLDGGILFLVGGFPRYGWIEYKHYKKECYRILKKMEKAGRDIFIKFHPTYKRDEKEVSKFVHEFSKKTKGSRHINITKHSVEDILGSCGTVDVVSLLSSVRLYANMNDQNVYSWFNLINKNYLSEDFEKRAKRFYKNVNPVEQIIYTNDMKDG